MQMFKICVHACRKYGLKIIIDLHAAPGSQNGFQHSSTRDGSQEWGKSDENIQQTVDVISFLTARYHICTLFHNSQVHTILYISNFDDSPHVLYYRYAKSPSLYAIELLNEPLSPGVTLERLTKYYKAGYDAVRKHSTAVYVVMSNRLGPSEHRELFPLANSFTRPVIDVHYYSIFDDLFENMTAQQNIDFIYNNRSSDLNFITASNGPLIFVGKF